MKKLKNPLFFVKNFFKKKSISEAISEKVSENKEIEETLMEAIWISRWISDEGISAVLTEEEAVKIVNDIRTDLYKKGYEIRKKNK